MKVNTNYEKLPGNYLFAEIAKRVKAYSQQNPNVDLIKLGIGDVTRPIPSACINAMKKAADEMQNKDTFRGYGPDYGYDFLLDAIRVNDYEVLGINIKNDEIFVSDGAKSDTSAIQELFDENVKIAVTDPVYPVYVDSNAMAGRLGDFVDGKWNNLVYLPCNAENGFVPEVPKEHVDVLYLCYPNNPTGTTLTKQQLKPFIEYAKKNNSIIIYDCAYKAFITSSAPHSIYEVEGAKEVAIECCSFSKTAGFTGMRCAYTIIPHELKGENSKGEQVELNSMWKRRMGSKFNGVSYPVQRAAQAVFSEEGKRECNESINYYMENAKIIREKLKEYGYDVYGGIDAPYVWLKTPCPSWEFFDLMLEKAHVVGTPGCGFGPSGEGYFRLTAFNTAEKTIEALKRIKNM